MAAKKKTPSKKKKVARSRLTIKVMGAYRVMLEINTERYESSGDTALEALKNLQIPQGVIKTKAIMHLAFGDKQAEKLFFALQLRRLQVSKMSMEIWAARLEKMLH